MSAQSIEPPTGDLRTLSRGYGGGGGAEQPASAERPAVPRPKFPWKTRVGVPGAILLALLLLIGSTAKDALWPARDVHVVPVVLKAVAGGGSAGPAAAPSAAGGSAGAAAPGAVTVQAPGWVEADPYPIAVTALAGGVVKDVLALEGQSVKKGDVVARLVDDDAKLALAKAEAELAQRQAALEAAQRTWDNPVDRTRAVATGEAMVAETRAMIEKHHAEQKVEEAKLAAAKEEFERTEQSSKERASSEIEFIRARQGYDAQQATVKAIIEQETVLRAQLAQREAELKASKENLRLRIEEKRALDEAKANLALATAARDEAALRLSRMQVRSPADGIVMQRLAEPGAKLFLEMDDPKSAQAVRLYDPKKLQVRVDVPLADAAKVGVGQPAQIVVGVLPDRTYTGKITRIVNEADIQKNTLQVKVAIDNPSSELKPEMLARVKFLSAPAPAVSAAATPSVASSSVSPSGAQQIFAPESLIDRGGGMTMVWIADTKKNVAEFRMIELGTVRSDGWIAVASGLRAGDQLITDVQGLKEGQKIRVVGEGELPSMPVTSGGSHGTH
jgi:RND family efflux transporter MFP subunit